MIVIKGDILSSLMQAVIISKSARVAIGEHRSATARKVDLEQGLLGNKKGDAFVFKICSYKKDEGSFQIQRDGFNSGSGRLVTWTSNRAGCRGRNLKEHSARRID